MSKKEIVFPCLPVKQGKTTLYVFSANAKQLWSLVQINQRDSNKETGYQRLLSPSRLRSITRFISSGSPVPTSILLSLSKAKVSSDGRQLTVTNAPDSGWVIDGQHRLAGAHQSTKDIELPVVAFLDLDEDSQIEQFVTINKEAKGVPTSLYYDLLSRLPQKSSADLAKERAADLANELKKDEESPFFGRIVVTSSPQKGEISLTNFVRKIAPLLLDGRPLHIYTAPEQAQIINNYFAGLRLAQPSKFNKSSVFFQTLGFGALINALPTAMNLCLKHYKAFKVSDVGSLFKEISHFDFDAWQSMGTGSAAEIQAGEDLKIELRDAFDSPSGGANSAIELV